MIEITDAAAEAIRARLVEGRVAKMFLAAVDATGANYGLAMGLPEEEDVTFESNGITIYMNPSDAEFLAETIIDYVDDEEMGTGFIIRGPLDDIGCGCGHDHEHEHGEDDYSEGYYGGCGCH